MYASAVAGDRPGRVKREPPEEVEQAAVTQWPLHGVRGSLVEGATAHGVTVPMPMGECGGVALTGARLGEEGDGGGCTEEGGVVVVGRGRHHAARRLGAGEDDGQR